MQHSLSALDWMICIGYLAIVFTMGLWFARQQHSNEDYFLGGRKMHWLPIGLSLFAGTFSSLSFVGLPSEAAYGDYHLYLAILFIPLIVTNCAIIGRAEASPACCLCFTRSAGWGICCGPSA